MGRWGDDIYQSDAALDYQATITSRLERELLYWLSPEQLTNDSGWVASVLAVIEVMLLFEQHEVGSSVYIRDEKAVQRWREVFLSVWNGGWQDTSYSYGDPEYRKKHRLAIIEMFDHLESVARYWTNLSKSSDQIVPNPFSQEYPIPYFSVRHWTNQDNKGIVKVERFMGELIEHLVKDIIYSLSPEKRAQVIAFNVEEVWVAVDILGFLSAIYERSPGVNGQVVRRWRDTTVQIWKQFEEGDQTDWDETDSLYQNVLRAFDRLEVVAQKYPPFAW